MEDEEMDNLENEEPDRDQKILSYLEIEGYSQTSTIHREVLSTVSIQSTRRILRNLVENKLISYKELPTTHKEGPGERVFFLVEDGLRILGKENYEIKECLKNLQKIRISCMRHYLKTREIEKFLIKSFMDSPYTFRSYNEFNGELHIKMKEKGEFINVRPDAHISITKNGQERLPLKLEMDMGTESLTTITKKMDSYVLFFSTLPGFPPYVLFVCSGIRATNLILKLKGHKISNSLLFLPIEKLSQDLLKSPVILDSEGKPLSLASIIEARDPILSFENAIETIARDMPGYEIVATPCFPQDPFFPLPMTMEEKTIFFAPDGYLRIKKQSHTEWKEAFFALVAVTNDEVGESLLEKIAPYEVFLQEYRSRVTSVKESFGLLIILHKPEKLDHILAMLRNSKISQRIRLILEPDCVAGKIFYEEVWMTLDGNIISLFPKTK